MIRKLNLLLNILNINFINELNKCDIIHTTGTDISWLWRTKRPILFTSMGADIKSAPFYSIPYGQLLALRRHLRTFLLRIGLKRIAKSHQKSSKTPVFWTFSFSQKQALNYLLIST